MTHTYRLTPRVAALTTLIGDTYGKGSTEYRLVGQLSDSMPRALRELAADTPDGYPTSTPGAAGRDGGRSTSTDTLGLLVARRERSTNLYSALCAAVGVVGEQLALGDRALLRRALSDALTVSDDCWRRQTRAEKTAAVEAVMCCYKQPDDMPADWMRPECENIASPDRRGMCEACYRRRYRALAGQDVA